MATSTIPEPPDDTELLRIYALAQGDSSYHGWAALWRAGYAAAGTADSVARYLELDLRVHPEMTLADFHDRHGIVYDWFGND